MSDTPRTDKAEGCRGYDDRWIVMPNGGHTTADFTRSLERELQEMIALAKALVDCGDPKPWKIAQWRELKSAIKNVNTNSREDGTES
jgi:hypothetical protein